VRVLLALIIVNGVLLLIYELWRRGKLRKSFPVRLAQVKLAVDKFKPAFDRGNDFSLWQVIERSATSCQEEDELKAKQATVEYYFTSLYDGIDAQSANYPLVFQKHDVIDGCDDLFRKLKEVRAKTGNKYDPGYEMLVAMYTTFVRQAADFRANTRSQ
jgi:hypothetical protein